MSNDFQPWGRRPEKHYSPETTGSLCNMCEHLWCRPYDKSKLHPYRYRCDAMHANLTAKQMYEMTTEQCPMGKKKARRFK